MPRTPAIAIVEDDEDLRFNVELYLRNLGYQIWGVGSAEAFYRQLVTQPVNLVIVDIGLPGEDGFQLTEYLASARRYGLVIVTGRTAVEDRVRGLTLGADIYLTKPVELAELEASIRAVLRRLKPELEVRRNDRSLPPWSLNLQGCQLRSPSGSSVELTARETELLAYLMQRPGEVIDKSELLLELTGSINLEDFHRIESMLYRMRKKVEKCLGCSLPVRSVFGRGLSFIGTVSIQTH
ncbi:response regulator transcription factor [Thiorhodococcus drewsii]|nr:response regulator transcription factor [Thiorhodococcus drewsii]